MNTDLQNAALRLAAVLFTASAVGGAMLAAVAAATGQLVV